MFLHSLAGWYEQYTEALKEVTEDVQQNIDHNFVLAIEYYGKALNACREDDHALKNIIKPNFAECLAQYGHYLYQAEDFVKALAFYFRAIEFVPNHLAAMNQIGMSYFKQNLFPEARKFFSNIFRMTKDRQKLADAWLNIACTFRLEKSWENAKQALLKAEELAPGDLSILDEKRQLENSKAQASLVASGQTIFNNPDVNRPEESKEPPRAPPPLF